MIHAMNRRASHDPHKHRDVRQVDIYSRIKGLINAIQDWLLNLVAYVERGRLSNLGARKEILGL